MAEVLKEQFWRDAFLAGLGNPVLIARLQEYCKGNGDTIIGRLGDLADQSVQLLDDRLKAS